MVPELKSDHAQQRIGVGDADEAPIKASSLSDQKEQLRNRGKGQERRPDPGEDVLVRLSSSAWRSIDSKVPEPKFQVRAQKPDAWIRSSMRRPVRSPASRRAWTREFTMASWSHWPSGDRANSRYCRISSSFRVRELEVQKQLRALPQGGTDLRLQLPDSILQTGFREDLLAPRGQGG